MGNQVGVAMSTGVHRLKPLDVAAAITGSNRVLTGKRWVPNDRVEAPPIAEEDLRELDAPVEGLELWRSVELGDREPVHDVGKDLVGGFAPVVDDTLDRAGDGGLV